MKSPADLSAALYLGIDGGGTKTQAMLGCIHDHQLRILGAGQGGPSNPRAVGFDQAFQNIEHAITTAFHAAGLDRVCVSAITLCLAGAGRLEEKSAVESWIAQSQIAQKARVVSEAEAVLEASHSITSLEQSPNTESEIALICGTGSLAWGRCINDHRQYARSGGWGYLLGDEGSGFWIGQKLLQVACQAADGRSPETDLLKELLLHLNLETPSQLIGWCYQDSSSRQRIAALAPLVFRLADSNIAGRTHSEIPASIIEQAAKDLAAMISSVANQLGTTSFRLALAGSVALYQPKIMKLIVDRLDQLSLYPSQVCVVDQPALGCLRLATA